MKILIRSAKIIQKGADLNGQVRDIFIENGVIRQIGEQLSAVKLLKVKIYVFLWAGSICVYTQKTQAMSTKKACIH